MAKRLRSNIVKVLVVALLLGVLSPVTVTENGMTEPKARAAGTTDMPDDWWGGWETPKPSDAPLFETMPPDEIPEDWIYVNPTWAVSEAPEYQLPWDYAPPVYRAADGAIIDATGTLYTVEGNPSVYRVNPYALKLIDYGREKELAESMSEKLHRDVTLKWEEFQPTKLLVSADSNAEFCQTCLYGMFHNSVNIIEFEDGESHTDVIIPHFYGWSTSEADMRGKNIIVPKNSTIWNQAISVGLPVTDTTEPVLNRTVVDTRVNQTECIDVYNRTADVVWTSENPKIVEITPDGIFIGQKRGTTNLIATMGDKVFTVPIKVRQCKSKDKEMDAVLKYVFKRYGVSNGNKWQKLIAYVAYASESQWYCKSAQRATMDEPKRYELRSYCQSAYSAIVDRVTVCGGAQAACSYVCNKLKIPCKEITDENHAWNEIKFGKKWQEVDLTPHSNVIDKAYNKLTIEPLKPSEIYREDMRSSGFMRLPNGFYYWYESPKYIDLLCNHGFDDITGPKVASTCIFAQ